MNVLKAASIVLLGWLCAAFYFSQLGDSDRYQSQLRHLERVSGLVHEIDNELLLLDVGRKADFDHLVALAHRLTLFVDTNIPGVDLNNLRQLVAARLLLLDDFKSDVSVYRNSAQAARRIIRSLNEARHPAEHAQANVLAEPVLSSLAFPNADSLRTLEEALIEFDAQHATAVPPVASLKLHAGILAEAGYRKIESASTVSSAAIEAEAQRLADHLKAAQADARSWEQFWHLVLFATGLMCALLFGYLAFRRSEPDAVDINQQSGNLSAR